MRFSAELIQHFSHLTSKQNKNVLQKDRELACDASSLVLTLGMAIYDL